MDIACLSHLRWNFVFQRPQHLLRRAAKTGRVLYLEEPVLIDGPTRLDVRDDATGVLVATPQIDRSASSAERQELQRELVTNAVADHLGREFVLWFYTPMALPFTSDLRPMAVVYDCMDELSAFAGAPPEMIERERELFACADLIFTGGRSLFEAKRQRHRAVYEFPSSVDVEHFARARKPLEDPPDQAQIPHPRLGYFGVLDERIDFALIADVADARADWQIVLVGPTAKIDPDALPRRPNIHYLGQKAYDDLPSYIAGWAVAILPFARNAATRYISPTKTPEYLAAGRAVVSTSIQDVVSPYGEQGLVTIADDASDFVRGAAAALVEDSTARLRAADVRLSQMSWDRTWSRMNRLVAEAVRSRQAGRQSIAS